MSVVRLCGGSGPCPVICSRVQHCLAGQARARALQAQQGQRRLARHVVQAVADQVVSSLVNQDWSDLEPGGDRPSRFVVAGGEM